VDNLEDAIDQVTAETNFSGVVRVDRDGSPVFAAAYGLANRAYGIANTVDGQFGTASATKGFTALTVVSLIEDGRLELSTTARSVLGADLPLIDDRVTVEHLLAHRSGIGDFLDESIQGEITDYVLEIPVHELATTEQYLTVLGGRPAKFAPDETFAYCNSGYVLLALIAERVSGMPFPELVHERVCAPAGMHDTAFLRSDELPGRAAIGYLDDAHPRTNVLHLPVRGGGDGGIYSTVADIHALWDAFFAGRIVSLDAVRNMVRPRSVVPEESMRYGMGFWLYPSTDIVRLEGFDAGVSFRSVRDPAGGFTFTVVANSSMGAWPVAKRLDGLFPV
jgi:CubicO group peptidase (beta-lactamase class C family)